jgi:hypothetical protein
LRERESFFVLCEEMTYEYGDDLEELGRRGVTG